MGLCLSGLLVGLCQSGLAAGGSVPEQAAGGSVPERAAAWVCAQVGWLLVDLCPSGLLAFCQDLRIGPPGQQEPSWGFSLVLAEPLPP